MKTARPAVRLWTVLLAAVTQMVLLCPTGASAQSPGVPTLFSTAASLPVARPAGEATIPAATLALPASDQAPSAALERLRRDLGPGDHVAIVQRTGDLVTGRVIRVGETGLDIRTEMPSGVGRKGERLTVTVPLDAIQSLERPRDSSKNGVLIGAAAGAGVGIALFAHAYAIDANEMDEWAGGYLAVGAIFTGVGALVGWGIDAAHSKPHLRYNAPTHPSTTVAMVPLRSRGLGMAVAVTF